MNIVTHKKSIEPKFTVHYRKGPAVIVIIFFLLGSVSALDFRTEEPIDFFSNTDMNGNLVRNLSDPVNSGDAVPLDYVQGKFVDRDGDTFSGNLNMNGNYIIDSPSTGQVSTYGLTGYWPFQDDQGYVKDWSKYGNDGALTGGEIVEGKVGRAVMFDGTGGYVNFEDSSENIEGSENLSISAWFNTRDDNGLILGSGNSQTDSGYWLAIRDSELEFRVTNQADETVTIDTPVSNDKWHHGTGTIGNGLIKLFLNGELVVNTTFSGDLKEMEDENLNTGTLEAGSSNEDALPFNGKIDELRIYGKKIDLRDAKTLYQMGVNGKQEVGGAWLSREGGVIYGRVDMDGDLDLSGNDIINPGDVDGVDLDNPGNGLEIGDSRYRIPENSIENDELNNSKSITVDGLKSTDNLNLTGNNITNVDTLNFESGASINGSLNTSGDINLNNGSINNLDSIDGGGDDIRVEDNLDMDENELVNVDGIRDNQGFNTIELDGSNNVEIPNGDLEMNNNRVLGIGTEGTFFDSGGNLVIAENRSVQIENSVGATKILELDTSSNLEIGTGSRVSNVEIPEGNLVLMNNDLDSVSGVDFSDSNQDTHSWKIEESSSSGGLTVVNESGSTVLKTVQDGSVEILNGDLIMNSNSISSVESLNGENGVNTLDVESGNSDDLELDVSGGGDVQLSGGNLDVNGHSITDGSSNNQIRIGDNSDDSVSVRAGGAGTFEVRTGDGSGGSTRRLQVTSGSGPGDVDIRNSNLDMNDNSIENYFGSECPKGETVVELNDDGSYQCRSISTQVSDLYVNRSGDSMTGDLNMLENQINNVSKLGVGTANPQENMDVDGTASIQSSGSEMEMQSDGDVVVTLG